MRIYYPLLSIAIFFCWSCQDINQNMNDRAVNTLLKKGMWRASLTLGEGVELPFNFEVDGAGRITIQNAKERIKVTDIKIDGDQIKITMPVFATYFEATIKEDSLKGVWVNPNKTNYHIPFVAVHGQNHRFLPSNKKEQMDLSGRWEVHFSANTDDHYPAIGIFKQQQQQLTGTYLTETGDYRYLEGGVNGAELALSCFDGAHAFLFTAKIKDSTIQEGIFYSGKHWQEPWEAKRNDSFKLADMDTLTYLKKGYDRISFAFPDENGDTIRLSDERFQGKVVIVQIMGTWCPNCMDETQFFVDLYNEYKDQGLEIIAIDYELKNDFKTFQKNIQQMKKDLNVNYLTVFGGPAKKSDAGKTLPMLNHILSYPTAIYIDRNASIQKIQTGFSGPGTGLIYQNYTTRTKKLIEQLLKR